MRSRGAVVASVGLALLAAGCDTLDQNYFKQGIGPELSRADLPEASRLQQIYIGNICYQAGLNVTPFEGRIYCDEARLGRGDWSLIVQAGMNDIDLRCDSYLTWLDDKKRSREPILKQLAAMGAATAAILSATRVGPTPIALVGIAFGLAAESFTNVNTRLLQELDQATVQTTVLGNQQKFRENLVDKEVVIDNKPAAIYLLRSYLRICMPFSIEMDINNTVTVYHRSGSAALADGPLLTRAPAVLKFTPLNDMTRRIRRFAFANTPNQHRVEGWLGANGINIPIEFFLKSNAYAVQQRRMIRELNIP